MARHPKKSRLGEMPSGLEKRIENWIPQTRLQGLRTGPEVEGEETGVAHERRGQRKRGSLTHSE